MVDLEDITRHGAVSGGADCSLPVQLAINSAASGIYVPHGEYYCHNVKIENKVNFRVVGPGVLKLHSSALANSRLLNIGKECVDVTIAGVTFDGNIENVPEFSKGIALLDSFVSGLDVRPKRIIVDNCKLRNNAYEAIRLLEVDYATVRGCVIKNTDVAIDIQRCLAPVVFGNTIENSGTSEALSLWGNPANPGCTSKAVVTSNYFGKNCHVEGVNGGVFSGNAYAGEYGLVCGAVMPSNDLLFSGDMFYSPFEARGNHLVNGLSIRGCDFILDGSARGYSVLLKDADNLEIFGSGFHAKNGSTVNVSGLIQISSVTAANRGVVFRGNTVHVDVTCVGGSRFATINTIENVIGSDNIFWNDTIRAFRAIESLECTGYSEFMKNRFIGIMDGSGYNIGYTPKHIEPILV